MSATRYTNRLVCPIWDSKDLPPVPPTRVADKQLEELIIDVMVDTVQKNLDIHPYIHLYNQVGANDYDNPAAVEFVEMVANAVQSRRYDKRMLEGIAHEVKLLLTAKYAVQAPDLLDILNDDDYDNIMVYADRYDEVTGGRRGGRRSGVSNTRDTRSGGGRRGVSDDSRGRNDGRGVGRLSEASGAARRPGINNRRTREYERDESVTERSVTREPEPVKELSANDVVYKGGTPPLAAFHTGRDTVTYTAVNGEAIQGVQKGFRVDYERHAAPYEGLFKNPARRPTVTSDTAVTKLAQHAANEVIKEPADRFLTGPIIVSAEVVSGNWLIDAITNARLKRIDESTGLEIPDVYSIAWTKSWCGFADIPAEDIKRAQYILDSIHGNCTTIADMVEKLKALPESFREIQGPRLQQLLLTEVNSWTGNMSLDINLLSLEAAGGMAEYLAKEYGEMLAANWVRGVAKRITTFFDPAIRFAGTEDKAEDIAKPYVELTQVNRLILTRFTGRELCLEIPETANNLPVHLSVESHPELNEILNDVIDNSTWKDETYRIYLVTADGYVVELMRSWTNLDHSFVIKYTGLLA